MSEASTSHRNNFGLLRLVFAMCVLVSHSFELVDGNRSREPLTQLFGTLSFGELGVDGFFLVSGYLITQSFSNSTSLFSYLWKRVLRIYPAFVVVYCLCILVVGPLSGADMKTLGGISRIFYILLLQPPWLAGAFADLHYPALNGSMWTIAYEFRCYLAIAALGSFGVLRTRRAFLILASALLAASVFSADMKLSSVELALVGDPHDTVRFASIFFCGAAFYIFRDTIRYSNSLAIIAAIMLIGLLFNRTTEELAMPILGGYLIFWFAFLPAASALNNINTDPDMSYGIYLFAWPIQSLLIKFIPGIQPLPVIVLTTLATAALALLSWRFIEKPSLSLKGIAVMRS